MFSFFLSFANWLSFFHVNFHYFLSSDQLTLFDPFLFWKPVSNNYCSLVTKFYKIIFYVISYFCTSFNFSLIQLSLFCLWFIKLKMNNIWKTTYEITYMNMMNMKNIFINMLSYFKQSMIKFYSLFVNFLSCPISLSFLYDFQS